MSSPFDKQRGLHPHEHFAFFGGLLFMFTLGFFMLASAEGYWRDASPWVAVIYAVQCAIIFVSVGYATTSRVEQPTILLLTSALVAAHFMAFGLVRMLWETEPDALAYALIAGRVTYYFMTASIAFGLACMVVLSSRREVLICAIAPGCLMTLGAVWLLSDMPTAGRVIWSVVSGLVLVGAGFALFELGHIPAIRMMFFHRAPHQLVAELQNAKRVHESMFPEPVSADGFRFGYAYRPMRQIGGDFIHLYPDEPGRSSDGTFYLTLIDVTGHGISSALTVNRLHAELQQYFASASKPCPSEALGYLNEYVRLTMAEHGLFATAMCVKVESGAGILTVANAGHPYCYYRGASGLREVEAEGPMLGVFPAKAFDATPVMFSIDAGDQLVMVTDGAIESRSPDDEPIGTDRLRSIIERSCLQTSTPDKAPGSEGLLQRRMTGRLLDRADVRKPVGLIQQVLRQSMNAHPCALADEIMLSIDDFVQQESQDDILIATIEVLKTGTLATSLSTKEQAVESAAVGS